MDFYLADLHGQIVSLIEDTNGRHFNDQDMGIIYASTIILLTGLSVFQLSSKTRPPCRYTGSAAGWTIRTSTVSAISSVTTVLAWSSMTTPKCFWMPLESELFQIGFCLLYAKFSQIQYIERSNLEHFYESEKYPSALEKKVTLLRYFRDYMNNHLMKTGTNIPKREGDEIARLPCLSTWFFSIYSYLTVFNSRFRTKSAIVIHLTNGTLQINFFQVFLSIDARSKFSLLQDHSKLILCPLMNAATYINDKKEVFTTKFSLISKHSCPKDLLSRLKYARAMCERLMSRSANSMNPQGTSVDLFLTIII